MSVSHADPKPEPTEIPVTFITCNVQFKLFNWISRIDLNVKTKQTKTKVL